MKQFLFFHFLLLINLGHTQSLYLGTGYFYEHYRQVGNKSKYHAERENYYWAFLGGSIAYNFERKGKWVKNLSIFGNFYPLMAGDDLRKYPNESLYYISQDLIAPEIGLITYLSALKKKKHQIDLGIGLSSRFVFFPITGSQFGYNSPTLSYKSAKYQKANIATTIPFEIRYTFQFKPQLGLFFSAKRTFGLYRWVENQISYEIYNTTSQSIEKGTVIFASNSNRSLIEFGLVFNFKNTE